MSAFLYEISGRVKKLGVAVSAISDFALANPQITSADTVLSSPDWSLYCLDFDGDQAVFVELPEGTDLAAVPFAYATQYEKALRVMTIPLADLPALAERVPPPENLALLFSTGRCGSTLASRILAQIPGVWSVSEPDAFTNLAFARFQLPFERVRELARAITLLACRPPKGSNPKAIVIKPRSEAVSQAEAYAQSLPEAAAVFLYRDIEGYVNSLYRFVQRVMGDELFSPTPEGFKIAWMFSSINAPLSLRETYLPEDQAEFDFLTIMALGWHLRVEAFNAAIGHGMKLTPIHYDDLNRDRRENTARLLTGCGISADFTDQAMAGFNKDAHAGSSGENAVPAIPIDDAQRQRVAELAARWQADDLKITRL